jgi:hypothetical protein
LWWLKQNEAYLYEPISSAFLFMAFFCNLENDCQNKEEMQRNVLGKRWATLPDCLKVSVHSSFLDGER